MSKDEQIAALEAILAEGVAYFEAHAADTDTGRWWLNQIRRVFSSGTPSEALARVKREAAASAVREFAAELRSRYPEDVWQPLEHADHKSVNDALAGRATGSAITRDRVSADMMRRAAAQADEYADEIGGTS